MPETKEEQIVRLKRNLMVTLRQAKDRLDQARHDCERGHHASFSINSGPNAVLDLLLSAQSYSTRISMLELE